MTFKPTLTDFVLIALVAFCLLEICTDLRSWARRIKVEGAVQIEQPVHDDYLEMLFNVFPALRPAERKP